MEWKQAESHKTYKFEINTFQQIKTDNYSSIQFCGHESCVWFQYNWFNWLFVPMKLVPLSVNIVNILSSLAINLCKGRQWKPLLRAIQPVPDDCMVYEV